MQVPTLFDLHQYNRALACSLHTLLSLLSCIASCKPTSLTVKALFTPSNQPNSGISLLKGRKLLFVAQGMQAIPIYSIILLRNYYISVPVWAPNEIQYLPLFWYQYITIIYV